MATDVETLLIRLEATQTKFERQLAKANGTANKRAKSIERRFAAMNRRLSSSFSGIGTALAGAFTIQAAQRFLDASTRIENSLKVAGLEGENLKDVYDKLFVSAQNNAAPLESLVELYGRAAQVQNELGVSTEQLLGFTDNVAVALRVSGKSAAESSGALLQLSQALGSGVVRAEEFNSILEGALPIAQAAAAGLEEAGGSVSKLRQLVIDGKISSEAFFKAFEAGSGILTDKVAKAELTVSQGFTRLTNVIIRAAGEFNDGSGASETFAKALDGLSKSIESVDFSAIGEEISDVIGWFAKAEQSVFSFAETLGQSLGADRIGELIASTDIGSSLGFQSTRLNNGRIDGAFATGGQRGSNPSILAGQIREKFSGGSSDISADDDDKPSKPVSLREFKLPKTGGRSRSSKRDSFAEEIAQIKERTAALQAETMVLSTLNPALDNQQFALDKLSVQRKLLNAAQESGVEITDQVRASIDSLAEGYAQAGLASEELAEKQKRLVDSQEEFRDIAKSTLSTFISDIREGTSAAEALGNALDSIFDRLLDGALDQFFSGPGPQRSTGGGFLSSLGSLFGGVSFDGGGYTGSGTRTGGIDGRGGFYGILHPNETVIDHTKSGGNLPSLAGRNGGGSQLLNVILGVSVDSNGNLRPFVEEVSGNVAVAVARETTPAIIAQAQKSTGQNLQDLSAKNRATVG